MTLSETSAGVKFDASTYYMSSFVPSFSVPCFFRCYDIKHTHACGIFDSPTIATYSSRARYAYGDVAHMCEGRKGFWQLGSGCTTVELLFATCTWYNLHDERVPGHPTMPLHHYHAALNFVGEPFRRDQLREPEEMGRSRLRCQRKHPAPKTYDLRVPPSPEETAAAPLGIPETGPRRE